MQNTIKIMFTFISSLFQYLHRSPEIIGIVSIYIIIFLQQWIKNEINDPRLAIDGLYLIKASYRKLYWYIV